jgi:predicted nucleic acid-binding protein
MSRSVLVDTSFLISFVDGSRKHHEPAMSYYRYLLENGIPIYFSTLVAAEFAIGQPITDLPLRTFRVLPFNLTHAIQAAALDFKELRKSEDPRAIVKEDIKILAQAAAENISHVLTEDERTLYRYCERLRAEGKIETKAIKLVDGFDVSWFIDGGQKVMTEVLNPKPPGAV